MVRKGKHIRLSNFQIKQISKYWFDLSKLTFASLILKLFEPEAPKFTYSSYATIVLGLIATAIFVMLGLEFSRKVK